jgi:hypothetical protein
MKAVMEVEKVARLVQEARDSRDFWRDQYEATERELKALKQQHMALNAVAVFRAATGTQSLSEFGTVELILYQGRTLADGEFLYALNQEH